MILIAAIMGLFAAWYRVTHYAPPSTPRTSSRPVPGEDDSLRVEVLNATPAVGLARIATWRLRDRGIDVVFFGSDSTTALDSTEVVVRRGGPEAAERVRRALGLGRVRTAVEPARMVDVTVRLGRDFQGVTLAGDP